MVWELMICLLTLYPPPTQAKLLMLIHSFHRPIKLLFYHIFFSQVTQNYCETKTIIKIFICEQFE